MGAMGMLDKGIRGISHAAPKQKTKNHFPSSLQIHRLAQIDPAQPLQHIVGGGM
jgi:hypothetical protein